MSRGKPQSDSLYDLCLLQADTAGAFDEKLLRHWYEAAVLKVLQFIARTGPVQNITETVVVRGDGTIRLNNTPSSDVKLTSGASLVALVPQPAGRDIDERHRGWCCYCHLQAHYTVGYCDDPETMPPDIKQAVCRVFTYMVENRGEEDRRRMMTASGAIDFLRPYLATAL